MEQPYETITSIGYSEYLKGVPTESVARRSDIMVTSTISMNIFPIDRRQISQVQRVQMGKDDLIQYIDEHNAFKAMCKENEYTVPKLRDKDKYYRDNYLRSFINKKDFTMTSLRKFKENVQKLNCNEKELPKISKER